MRCVLPILILLLLGCGGDLAPGLDGAVVGSWRATFKIGHVASDSYMTLRRDGTYEFSSRTESRHPGTDTQLSPTYRGKWKAEGGKLWHTRDGRSDWIESGEYKLSGRDSMMIKPPGGMAILWQRTQ